ncbi:MAG: LysM peptidoglycan-binding domain-containing protein [Verrucomicrobiae bacterium]|nr:LysM peptidoglycan-binding domain-containing protein [Verrucomicrobiae bacterium]
MKLLLLPALLCVLLLSGCDPFSSNATSPEAQDENNKNFQKAKERYGLMDYDGAVDYFERALRDNPKLAKAHLELALIYDEKKQDYVSAIFHFERYLRLRPDSGKKEMVQDFLNAAKKKLHSAGSDGLSAEKQEIIRLQAENDSLRAQIADLRKRTGVKAPLSMETTATPQAASKPSPEPALKSVSPPPALAAPAPAKVNLNDLKAPGDPLANPPLEPFKSAGPTPAPPAPSTPSAPQNYTVLPGDNLSKISKKFYGASSKWQIILDANTNTIREPKDLKPGMTLVIPPKQ